MAGFHHIVNRGVARDNVYKCDEDKDKYLERYSVKHVGLIKSMCMITV